jgi:outer membrane cobalamin receptor
MHWKGARADIDPDSFARITDRAYDVWSVGANWQWTRDLRLSGRIENIFNKGYQEVAGYNSTPLAGSIGLTLSL